MITVVDYGMGNLGSIQNMLLRIGAECQLSSSPKEILAADKLILPGVGHFGKAMDNLKAQGLVDILNEAVLEREIPLLGICLGQQLLTRGSEEGGVNGLGWIEADVKRITFADGPALQIPHMGWNTLDISNPSPILDDRFADSRYYFVHSYQVFCDAPENVLAKTEYGSTFHSAIIQNNIMGVQFHPEKSHKYGFRLLANFANWRADGSEEERTEQQLFSSTDINKNELPENDDEPASTGRRVPARVIPTLLIMGSGLVKTEKFKAPKYVGDPRNAVKIFNEKEVDELVILDINATAENREPNYELLAEIISEAFMPIAYGGAIRTLAQARRVLAMGAEKILVNTAAVENPDIVREAAEHFGSQSVVVVIDVRKGGLLKKSYKTCYFKGKKNISESPADFAKRMENLGAGEILLQSIDREGTQEGYDLDLIRSVTEAVQIPVIASGGAGRVEDFRLAVEQGGAAAVAAGSLFVFQGRHRAVLISYPKPNVLRRVFETAQ